MKAILVMEMPEGCLKCPMGNMNLHDMSKSGMYCQLNKREDISYDAAGGSRPGWCPLVAMPERKEERLLGTDIKHTFRYGASCGWNACLDAIEGREKDG